MLAKIIASKRKWHFNMHIVHFSYKFKAFKPQVVVVEIISKNIKLHNCIQYNNYTKVAWFLSFCVSCGCTPQSVSTVILERKLIYTEAQSMQNAMADVIWFHRNVMVATACVRKQFHTWCSTASTDWLFFPMAYWQFLLSTNNEEITYII